MHVGGGSGSIGGRSREGSAGYGLGRDGPVLPVASIARSQSAKRRTDDHDTRPPAKQRDRDTGHAAQGATMSQITALMAQQAAQQEAKVAAQIAAAMAQLTAAMQHKDAELNTAHRVHDQLRAEAREAHDRANHEHAHATSLQQKVASTEHDLATIRSEHSANVAATTRAMHHAEQLARTSVEVEFCFKNRAIVCLQTKKLHKIELSHI